MTPERIAKVLLDALGREYGPETFVTDGYAYYGDALNSIASAIAAERDRAQLESQMTRVLEDACRYIVEHKWAAEKPKWANEFVDVARGALERVAKMREGKK